MKYYSTFLYVDKRVQLQLLSIINCDSFAIIIYSIAIVIYNNCKAGFGPIPNPAFFHHKPKQERRRTMSFINKHLQKIKHIVLSFVISLMLSFGFASTVYADTIDSVFTNAVSALTRVFTNLLLVVNPAAALFLVIAFLMRMFSKNQRTVEDANSWIKRILISVALINAVGFIIIFARDIIPDGGTTIPN